MSTSEDNAMILDALREVKEESRIVSSDYRETREALIRVTTEQKTNKEEIAKARKHREQLERRVTVIESQNQGAQKTSTNVIQYVSLLVAIGAAITGLVSILK